MRVSKSFKVLLFASGTLLAVGALLLAVIGQADRLLNRVANESAPPVSNRAHELHFSSSVVDLHSDALMWNRDVLARNQLGHVDLPRLIDGGVTLQVFSAGTNMALGPTWNARSASWPDYYTFHALALRWPRRTVTSQLERALYMADRLHDAAARSRGQLLLIRIAEDLESLGPDVVGSLLSLEGAHALEGELSNLQRLYDVGFRVIGLTHFIDNPFAGSANGMGGGGLTPLGDDLLREMERLGIVPDLAHASPQTIRDVAAETDKPLLVTHTGLQATCNQPRNLSDEDVRVIAETGGVIGISFGEVLICGSGVDDVIDSIQHVIDLAGDEHVALGSDFDGAVTTPFDAAGLPALTGAMMEAGMKEDSIRRILGENALRVFAAWLR